jgi:two-component system, NarL family, nitrate/nitrite response regulator NarL
LPTSHVVRVALVDDHPLYRKCVRDVLCQDPQITVVSEGGSASEALEIARYGNVDLMLLDVSMPGSGLEAARLIGKECPGIRVVMLSSSERQEDISDALLAGAKGYIVKGIRAPDLIEMVHTLS